MQKIQIGTNNEEARELESQLDNIVTSTKDDRGSYTLYNPHK